MPCSSGSWLIAQEARALLTRLARVEPFALHETMVAAAAPTLATRVEIDRYLAAGRRVLRHRVRTFVRWLSSPRGRTTPVSDIQRQFTLLRLQFNSVLAQFDIFADALTQRSEHRTGVWIAGLDALARDALVIPGVLERVPNLICYVDRGHGAAIRRARTRLPGGGESPVAVIRVPRERMVGSGIASSLVHEVGHQAAELLGLHRSLRPVLNAARRTAGRRAPAWELFLRWLGEILADAFSVARVGVGSTLGLIGVVSLPRVFVFRTSHDVHPTPWLRVKLSTAIGDRFYPHPQWRALERMWECFYPRDQAPKNALPLLSLIEEEIPAFVDLLASHRPPALRGRTVAQALTTADRRPERLAARLESWLAPPIDPNTPPTLAFAMLGQARLDGRMSPEGESYIAGKLLTMWAMTEALGTAGSTRPLALKPGCGCRQEVVAT